MSESLHDDARLRATETQMRRALGLAADTQVRSTPTHSTDVTYGSHRQRHRFIRDGEVPVTFIRRSRYPVSEPGTNQLDAARQAVRFPAVAGEHSKRLAV
jgi:hypothetical protein